MASIVDSSVWVALFLDFDTQHEKAKRFFRRLKGRVYLPYGVVSEVVTILVYKHSKSQANEFIAFLEDNRDLEFIEGDTVRELDFYTSIDSRISLTDATLLMLSKKLKATLVTFDRQLRRLEKKV